MKTYAELQAVYSLVYAACIKVECVSTGSRCYMHIIARGSTEKVKFEGRDYQDCFDRAADYLGVRR
jgi:hypothetical protein